LLQFNHWAIGGATANNGILLLHVAAQRKVEIVAGDGMTAELSDMRCHQILMEHVIPRFRSGRFGEGLASGVAAISAALRAREASSPGGALSRKGWGPPPAPTAGFGGGGKKERGGGAWLLRSVQGRPGGPIAPLLALGAGGLAARRVMQRRCPACGEHAMAATARPGRWADEDWVDDVELELAAMMDGDGCVTRRAAADCILRHVPALPYPPDFAGQRVSGKVLGEESVTELLQLCVDHPLDSSSTGPGTNTSFRRELGRCGTAEGRAGTTDFQKLVMTLRASVGCMSCGLIETVHACARCQHAKPSTFELTGPNGFDWDGGTAHLVPRSRCDGVMRVISARLFSTGIHLCDVCSCHDAEGRGHGRPGGWSSKTGDRGDRVRVVLTCKTSGVQRFHGYFNKTDRRLRGEDQSLLGAAYLGGMLGGSYEQHRFSYRDRDGVFGGAAHAWSPDLVGGGSSSSSSSSSSSWDFGGSSGGGGGGFGGGGGGGFSSGGGASASY
jgi:hypothetical protein